MGIGVSLAAGFTLGSLPAATIGLGFVSGEMLYNGAKWWSGEMNKVLYNFESGINNGWVPGMYR